VVLLDLKICVCAWERERDDTRSENRKSAYFIDLRCLHIFYLQAVYNLFAIIIYFVKYYLASICNFDILKDAI
jgi:hypothetical protein